MIAVLQYDSIRDFIPFTSRVYFRLIEQHNETFWPLQAVALFAGVAAVFFALSGRGRTSLFLLVPVWCWVGASFFFQRYGELVWAGPLFGASFWIQGVVLAVGGFCGITRPSPSGFRGVRVVLGCLLAAGGLLLYPLLTGLRTEGWGRAECFGIFPDPTAWATVGLLLIVLPGRWMVLFLPIPLLWALVGAATLWGLRGG